jgi:hypothetical protein
VVVAGAGTDADGRVLVAGDAPWSSPHPERASAPASTTRTTDARLVIRFS